MLNNVKALSTRRRPYSVIVKLHSSRMFGSSSIVPGPPVSWPRSTVTAPRPPSCLSQMSQNYLNDQQPAMSNSQHSPLPPCPWNLQKLTIWHGAGAALQLLDNHFCSIWKIFCSNNSLLVQVLVHNCQWLYCKYGSNWDIIILKYLPQNIFPAEFIVCIYLTFSLCCG